jgi:NTE family protein
MTRWLHGMLGRVRDFAYAEQPPPPAQGEAQPLKVGLALGGGFARGIAHLGVLHALEQHGIPIDYIAGTSAGALAGLAYATGLPFDLIVRQATALRFRNFGQWKVSRMGLASNQPLETYPQRYLRVSTFEELKIPMAIAATDLLSGEPVYFTRGPIGPALRASCAYPGLFQPVEYKGRLLVDGFVGATVPVEAARMMGAEIIIAVFLEADGTHKPTNITDVIGRSFNIVQQHADTEWRSRAQVLIAPNVREFAWDDFAKTPQLVAAGEQAALEALPRVTAALRSAAQETPSMPSSPKHG